MLDETLAVETSFAQRSLWLQNQLDPGQPTYNVTAVVAIHGPLDTAAVQYALNVVVDRHETLRTVFDLDGDVPVQVIQPAASLSVAVLDAAADDVESLVRAEVRRPFDLRTGPLVRFTLLRTAADHHVAVLVMHHIVTDGVSSALLFDELATAYAARLAGRSPDLPELPVQYADFAVWQRETLTGDTLGALTDYWTDRLAGARAVVLPTDRPRSAVSSSAGGAVRFTIPVPLANRLAALAKAERATLFMVLLAALDVLLARYCGQDDITVTSPTTGRTRPELERLIGYFVNPLPLRVDLSGDPTFADLLGRVKTTCVGAFEHQELPFELITDLLRAERRSGVDDPQAQVMLVLQNMRRADWRIAGLVFQPLRVDTGTAKVDLVVDLEPGPDGYDGVVEYSADVFDEDTVLRLADHLLTVLDEVADDPGRPISRITVLTRAERERAARGQAAALVDGRVDEAIGRRAARTPDAIAVDGLSYAELDSRGTALARRLRSAGVRPGTVVALVVEPSAESLVAVLAVLRADAAYLPLDPDDPPARRQRLIDAAGAVVLHPDLTLTPHDVSDVDGDRPKDLARLERAVDGGLAAATHAAVLSMAVALGAALELAEGTRLPVGGLPPAEFTGLAIAGLAGGATLDLTAPAPAGLTAQVGGFCVVAGRRLPHCSCHILDRHGAPLPDIVPGELWLGGPAVGRGYPDPFGHNRFAPDPHGGPDALRYRTGLLARCVGTDRVEIIGRVDGMLDVAGEVVDPSEIEAAIGAASTVAECAVVARGEPALLVAYVVPRIGARIDAAALRDTLACSLPDRLVPVSIIEVGVLPRDADGALDLDQLPAPEQQRTTQAAEHVAPRTPFEVEIAAIWAELLGRERIGVYDNFFDLGGQSLAAVLVAARIRDRFGIDLVVRDLYADFTVAETAWQVLERVMADQPEWDGAAVPEAGR